MAVTSVAVTGVFTVHRRGLGHLVTFSDVSRTKCVVLNIVKNATRKVATLMCCMLMCTTTGLNMFTIVAVMTLHDRGFALRSCTKLCGAGPGVTLLVALSLFSLTNVPPFTKFFSGFFVFVTTFSTNFRLLMFVTLIGAIVSLCCCLLVIGTVCVAPSSGPVPAFHDSHYAG